MSTSSKDSKPPNVNVSYRNYAPRNNSSQSNSNKFMNYDEVVIQGYLQKQSKTVKKFRQRWMVLTRTKLYSFKNLTKNPTESFDLKIYNKLTVINEKQFEILTNNEKQSRMFIAETAEEVMQWITFIGNIQKKLADQLSPESTKFKMQKSDSCLSSDDEDIKEQLKKFGYTDDEIQTALKSAAGKAYDINDIHEYIKMQQLLAQNKDLIDSTEFEDPSNWDKSLQTLECLETKQQFRILSKLKKIADKMLKESYKKYDKIYLDKSKLKYTILIFAGGLQFLYNLGFEEYSNNKLMCKNINPLIISACIECLDNKIKTLMKNKNKNRNGLSNNFNDNMNIAKQSLYDFNPFTNDISKDEIEPGQNGANNNKYQPLWEEYIALFGKPKRAENLILWAKKNANVNIKFIDAKNLIKNNGHIVYDMHKRDKSFDVKNGNYKDDEKQMLVLKKKKRKSNINGQTKQFKKFLKEHRLDKYFNKFKTLNCCNICDIEYLYDDEQFLIDDIGIKNVMERRRFIGECKKLQMRIIVFRKIKMSGKLRQKLNKFGVVTRDILCKEVRNKMELRSKYGLNDEQCDFLWDMIELEPNVEEYNNDDNECVMNEGTEEEGVENNVMDVIDTMYGYKLNEQIVNKQNENFIANDIETPYM